MLDIDTSNLKMFPACEIDFQNIEFVIKQKKQIRTLKIILASMTAIIIIIYLNQLRDDEIQKGN